MPTESDPAGRLGVVIKNVVPLRRDPDDDTEQVSQALLGQPMSVEGGQGDWLFVQTWDTYRGWIPSHAVRILDDQSRPYASTGPVAVIRELIVDVLKQPRDTSAIITKATVSDELEAIEARGEWVELRMPDGDSGFVRKDDVRLVDRDTAHTIPLPDTRKLVETGVRFVGVPYLWGGTSPFGIDCSGLVQLIYRIHGITLLRDADIQAGDPRAEPVDRKHIRAGDLIFFGKGAQTPVFRDLSAAEVPKRTDPDTQVSVSRELRSAVLHSVPETPLSSITHVGMALDNKRFVHASGDLGVAITPIDAGHPPAQYWGARRMRLATLDPGGGVSED